MPATPCLACGRCCAAEVAVTLADVARLAAHLGEPPESFFRRALGPSLSPLFGLPTLAKRPDGICLLEDAAGRCTVHPVKPRICRAFVCLEHPAGAPGDDEALGIVDRLCASPEAVATRAYLARRGLAWDAKSFFVAVGAEPAGTGRSKI